MSGTIKPVEISTDPLLDYKVTVPNQRPYREFLKGLGYEKRAGSVDYERPWLVILPFRRWYWESGHQAPPVLSIATDIKFVHRLLVEDGYAQRR